MNPPHRKVTGNRTELWGRIARPAELRSTPTGTAVLRLAVACGVDGDELVLTVVMTGESARELAQCLKPGREVRVAGQLRVMRGKAEFGKPGIEVMADSVKLLD
ncbi:MAG TPA: single-stranded DNA-binding protein [Candidatus Binataceae bacterium]|nr:single-stranded DNA-binding protein [Candidatus Binataceae bacterium]